MGTGNFSNILQHGAKDDPVIAEQALLLLTGSKTVMQTELANLRLAFKAAERRYDSKRGDRVYLKYQLDGLSTKYQSEIVRPQKTARAARYVLPKGDRFGLQWGEKMKVGLELTRENEWLADSETEIPLANGNGS